MHERAKTPRTDSVSLHYIINLFFFYLLMENYRNAFIKFDSPRAVFYPGQVITGSLEIELDGPLTFSVIYVKFLGEAIVDWQEQESETINDRKFYRNVEYGSIIQYFKGSELLAGSHDTILNLNPGKYSYPFSFKIPGGIPSSFKGSHGRVEYYVEAHVEYQTKPITKIKRNFDIVTPRDLNLVDAVREPIELEFDEVLSCGCFGGDAASIRVRVPFSGYCPGQNIPLDVKVHNRSNMEINGLIFELLTRERYVSKQPVAEYIQPEKVLGAVKRGSIMSRSQRNFTVELKVPEFIAPNLEDCEIIDVGYFIRVTIKVSGCNDDLQDEAELCLGLVPLRETVEGTYTHPMDHSLPVGAVPNPGTTPDWRQSMPEVQQTFIQTSKTSNAPGEIGFQINIKHIGFVSTDIRGSATSLNRPGNGPFPSPYGTPMRSFTAPGVYPYPNAPSDANAPSAPPM